MRLFAWSDLHVDHPDNLGLVAALSDRDFQDAVLVIAGDVSSSSARMIETLAVLKSKFAEVAFVPGNHDLWVNTSEPTDSLAKLHELRAACRAAGVRVEPFSCVIGIRPVRIVPLIAWYLKPEEGRGSLFIEKPGEDPDLLCWADNRRIRWPALPDNATPAAHLLGLNGRVDSASDLAGSAPRELIVTFSHFLPRMELMFHDWEGFRRHGHPHGVDPHPEFNFSRVAGCLQLDDLLRRAQSALHVYGHQHRNRTRLIAGVQYVSHCLGYPAEWQEHEQQPTRCLPLELTLDG